MRRPFDRAYGRRPIGSQSSRSCWLNRLPAAALVIAVCLGCGGPDEKVQVPENPVPLPGPGARLTRAADDAPPPPETP